MTSVLGDDDAIIVSVGDAGGIVYVPGDQASDLHDLLVAEEMLAFHDLGWTIQYCLTEIGRARYHDLTTHTSKP